MNSVIYLVWYDYQQEKYVMTDQFELKKRTDITSEISDHVICQLNQSQYEFGKKMVERLNQSKELSIKSLN